MKRHALLGVAMAVAAGLACQEEEFGPLVPTKWGLVTLDHQNVAGSDYTRPVALFYTSVSSPAIPGRGPSEICNVFSYPPPADDEAVEEVPAGASVTVDIAGTEHTLVPTTIGSRTPYSMPAPGAEYTPGDSVEVRIPGTRGGFPEMTIRGQTAEAFALGAIATDVPAGGLTVTWTPAGDDSSRMIVSLQYHTSTRRGTGLNEHVLCNFRDDGSATISPLTIAGWRSAAGERRAHAVRWRTALAAEDDALLYLISTYSVTKNTFP